MKRKLFGALAALAMALMWGAAASDAKVVVPDVEAEIRPVGQPGFVHEGRLYGVFPRRDGNLGEIVYSVNLKRDPRPRDEHVLNRDVRIKWKVGDRLSLTDVGQDTNHQGWVWGNATVVASEKGQWGKVHDVHCEASWPLSEGGGSPDKRGQVKLTGHAVAPVVKFKEIHFNHQTGQNANDAIDLVAEAKGTKPGEVVPEYVIAAEEKDPEDAVPLYGTQHSVNHPCAYIPGIKPSVKAVFTVTPWFVPRLTVSSPAPSAINAGNPYQILEGLPEAEATPQAGGASVNGGAGVLAAVLQDTRETPRVVSNNALTLRWRIESIAGAKTSGAYWEDYAKTIHDNVYTLLDAPKMPWNDGGGGKGAYPWFGALEFVIGPAKNGKTCGTDGIADAHEAMRKITEYLFYRHGVKYNTYTTGPLYTDMTICLRSKWFEKFDIVGYINTTPSEKVVEDLKGQIEKEHLLSLSSSDINKFVNCYDQAAAVHCLSGLLGISSKLRFIGPFGELNTTKIVGYEGIECNRANFANNPDDAFNANNPGGFGNHAVCAYQGSVFDACMGPFLGLPYEKYLMRTINNFSQLKGTPDEPNFIDIVCRNFQ